MDQKRLFSLIYKENLGFPLIIRFFLPYLHPRQLYAPMNRLFFCFLVICPFLTTRAQEQAGDITEHISKHAIYNRRLTYPDHTTIVNPRLPFNNSITPQGMAIYHNKLYQFRNGGYCQVVDIKSMRQAEAFYIPMSEVPSGANAMHLGAVAFSNEYPAEKGYTKEEGGLPYLYALLGDDRRINGERYGTVAVFDINHNYNILTDSIISDGESIRPCRLIRFFRLKLGGNTAPNFIAAFDFDNSRGWVFGYDEPKNSGATKQQTMDFLVREFNFAQNGTGDITRSVLYNGDSFIVDAKCGNLQDCTFTDGLVFLSTGGSPSKKNPMNAHIAVFNPEKRAIIRKTDMLTQYESEGIDVVGDTIFQTFHIKRSLVRIMKIKSSGSK